jgi:integrase
MDLIPGGAAEIRMKPFDAQGTQQLHYPRHHQEMAMAIRQITTTRQLSSVKLPDGVTVYRERVKSSAPGLYIEVRARKRYLTWVYRFRLNDKRRDMVLGKFPQISLAEARDLHREAAALVLQGIDPLQSRAARIAENKADLTMRELVDRWLTHQSKTASIKPETIRQHRWRWDLYLSPHLADIRLSDLKRAHLAAALDETRKASREHCRKGLTTLNLALDYAVARQLIAENPARILKPKDFEATMNKPRERWLSLKELRLLWNLLDVSTSPDTEDDSELRASVSRSLANALKLLILTGARRGEVAGMRWNEIDLENGVWTIPPSRAKNASEHTVYLSDLGLKLLGEQQALGRGGQHVFESPVKDHGAIHVDATTQAVGRVKEVLCNGDNAKMVPFSVHDLRRTAASHWNETLGVDEQIVELMLNHRPQNKLVATYQQGKHRERQRQTWIRWDELVATQVALDPEPSKAETHTAANVVPFRRR